MNGVSFSGGYWAYNPPKGVDIGKRMLKAKTLAGLYESMQRHGVDVDARCDEKSFVNECPSKLIISNDAVTARIRIVDDRGVDSMPSLRFEFNQDSVVSFTSAMVGALRVLEVEKVNNRLNQLVKYLQA